MSGRPSRPRTVDNYAILVKGRLVGSTGKSKRKSKTPKRRLDSGIKKGSSLTLHSSNGQWSVTPLREDLGLGTGVDKEGSDNTGSDLFTVAEDREILDVHATEGDEFGEELAAAKASDNMHALQLEVAEMEKKVELKKLRALQKCKEQLQRELEASDEEEESTRHAAKRLTGGKGKGKRIGGLNVNDDWEGLMS